MSWFPCLLRANAVIQSVEYEQVRYNCQIKQSVQY